MVSSIIATLAKIREGRIDQAIEIQERLLCEIVMKNGPSPKKYSRSDLVILQKTFVRIADYFATYPENSRSSRNIIPGNKQGFVDTEAVLTEVLELTGWDEFGQGYSLATTAVLSYSDYIVDITINTLLFLHNDKIDDALWRAEDVLDMIAREDVSILSGPHYASEREMIQLHKIKRYRTRYPRTSNDWYPYYSASKKEEYHNLDENISHMITSDGILNELLTERALQKNISFYRDNFSSAVIATLIKIRQQKNDEATEILELLLDETIIELVPDARRYSAYELEILQMILAKVADYRVTHPRKTQNKAKYIKPKTARKVDRLITEGTERSNLIGSDKRSSNTITTLLLFRKHVTDEACNTSILLSTGQKEAALRELEEVLDMIIFDDVALLSSLHDDYVHEANMLYEIKKYRSSYPRTGNAWFATLSDSQKEECRNIDTILANMVSSHRIPGRSIGYFD